MKKAILIFVSLTVVFAATAYIFYQIYLPHLIAEAVIADDVPDYIPRRFQHKIEAVRRPLNKGSEDVVKEMHKANIPMEKMLAMIDHTTEAQAYGMLEELNQTKLTDTDQVFEIIKKHFPAEFDLEVFRKSFNDHVDLKMIKKAMRYGNMNRRTKDIDIETAKAIAKKILVEKEKETRLPPTNENIK